MHIEHIGKQKTLLSVTNNDLNNGTFFIPEDVTVIGSGAFSWLKDLTHIKLPASVISIEESAFFGCPHLANVILPANLQFIGESAFHGCPDLSHITLPDNLHFIRKHLFFMCTKLTTVTLSDNVIFIDENAFFDCRQLKHIIIKTDNPEEMTRIKGLLPLHLKNLVLSAEDYFNQQSIYSIQQSILDSFCAHCPWVIEQGTTKKFNNNVDGLITRMLPDSNNDEFSYVRALSEAMQKVPVSSDLKEYEAELKQLMKKHMVLYKLKTYLKCMEQVIPSDFFSEKEAKLEENQEILDTYILGRKILDHLENNATLNISVEDKALIAKKPKLRELLLNFGADDSHLIYPQWESQHNKLLAALNKQYNKLLDSCDGQYKPLAQILNPLIDILNKEGNILFAGPVKKHVDRYHENCLKALNFSKEEFKKISQSLDQQFWKELNPLLPILQEIENFVQALPTLINSVRLGDSPARMFLPRATPEQKTPPEPSVTYHL